MNNKKNGTEVYYKVLCAVIFFIFSFIYVYFYQADVLAAGQHIASGGRTQYGHVLGTVLIIVALKLLQNGIQAIARLKNVFFALTYLPSLLIMAMITDLPSRPGKEITFGAWVWALPLVLIVWAAIVYVARQYQSIGMGTRGEGLLSQVLGVNLSIMLLMMLVVCLIGNHNRLFHQRMHVENLISRNQFKDAVKAVNGYKSTDYGLSMLRVYALAQDRLIGDSLFNGQMKDVSTIIPSVKAPYTVIVSKDNEIEAYKRNADWQLCELLVRKNLGKFYNNLIAYYNLNGTSLQNDSTDNKPGNKPVNKKALAKLNAYKDSLMSERYKKLPRHYQEALVLLNAQKSSPGKPFIKDNYFDEQLLRSFGEFQKASEETKRKMFSNSYWLFFYD